MDHKQANGFVTFMRKLYNPIGFKKGYNAILWFVCSGYLFGFTLARLMYYNYNGIFCGTKQQGGNGAAPGECYFYLRGHYRIGMMLHLFTIFPAAILVLLQFIPAIRYRSILFHRINGYLVVLLVFISIAGALMIARVSFGGGLAVQSAVGFLALISVTSLVLAYINIKRLQIDQHRAWMLRAWVYMACIITTRIIMVIGANIASMVGDYYTARPCAQIAFSYGNDEAIVTKLYPNCASYFDGSSPNEHTVVQLLFTGGGRPEQIGSALGESFAMGLWLAIVIHAIGVEIYLKLTPREFERLKQVSYERQLEAGFRHPGSAGLTVDRLGDAEPWTPKNNPKRSLDNGSLQPSAEMRAVEPK